MNVVGTRCGWHRSSSVLLGPNTGTQGRQMTPRVAIASALAVVGAFTVAPAGAMAASPVLSGYGGPGAGDQMIIGSTLLNGPSKGPGSSGHDGSAEAGAIATPSAGGSGGRASGVNSSAGAIAVRASGSTGATSGGSVSAVGSAHPTSDAQSSGGFGGLRQRGASFTAGGTFAYPGALRTASADAPVLGLGTGDLAELLAVAVGLAALGFLTVRMARLRR